MSAYTAILINSEGVQAISMARSLRKLGYRVVGFCNRRCSSGYVSRYLSERLKSPDISSNPKEFQVFLYDYLQAHKVRLVIPLADDGADFLSRHKSDIEHRFETICAVPSFIIFDRISDKSKLMLLCERIGVTHPKMTDLRTDNVKSAAEYTGFPALIKPNHSQGAKGITRVENVDEIKKALPDLLRQFHSCSLQSYIIQPDYYYNVMLYRNKYGIFSGTTVIKIRRFFPLKGGSSCYCETVSHPQVVEQCKTVLDAVNWVGFADFDVLEDVNSGELNIIEVNPRMPSSLQAAYAAGVDFGSCIDSDLFDTPAPVFRYKEGCQIRWMGLDFMWFVFSPNRFRFKPSWFRFWGKNVSYQDGSWADPLPMLAGILAGVLKYLNPQFRKAKLKG